MAVSITLIYRKIAFFGRLIDKSCEYYHIGAKFPSDIPLPQKTLRNSGKVLE